MNEEILKDMPEYVRNLPKPVQDLVFDGVWEERTSEIAKKYSLNETQTESLTNNVLLVLIGLLNPDNFSETTMSELGISKLLTDQLIEDLETRVFDYSIKIIDEQENKLSESKKNFGQPTGDTLELRPEIMPMVEPGEKIRVRPVPVGFSDTTPKPVPKPQTPAPELVQRPVSVPRYTAAPLEEDEESVSQKNTPVVKPVNPQAPAAPAKTPEPVPEPVKRYTVDPYREPIE